MASGLYMDRSCFQFELFSTFAMAALAGRVACTNWFLFICMGRECLFGWVEAIFAGLDYRGLLSHHVDGYVFVWEIYVVETRRPICCFICPVCSVFSH